MQASRHFATQDALPLVESDGGGWRIRTTEGMSQQIYSLPQLTALVTPRPIEKKNTRRYVDSQAFFKRLGDSDYALALLSLITCGKRAID